MAAVRLPLAETRSRRGRWPGCLPTVALLPRIMWEGKGWGTDGSPTFQPCGRPSSSSSKAASLQLQVDRRRNATVLMTQGEAEKAAATTRAAARSGRGGDARGRLGRLEARAERIKRVCFFIAARVFARARAENELGTRQFWPGRAKSVSFSSMFMASTSALPVPSLCKSWTAIPHIQFIYFTSPFPVRGGMLES